VFMAAHSSSLKAHPVREVWTSHRRSLVRGFALVAPGALAFNTYFIFMPNHLVATSDREPSAALLTAVLGLLCAAVAGLSLGALSDRVGRRPVVVSSVALLTVGAVPIALSALSGSLWGLILADIAAGAVIGGVFSFSALAELFPTGVRGTGLAMTAGLASAVVGGTGPFVDQVLFQVTGFALAPTLYIVSVAGVALVVVWSWPETAFRDLA